jgi:hypothetical protein
MSPLLKAQQAQNDNARTAILQRIEETIELLRWYKETLQRVDPTLSQRDRRVLMFTVARAVDVFNNADVQRPTGIIAALVRHFGVRL